jgi:cysteine-rich repeat protein
MNFLNRSPLLVLVVPLAALTACGGSSSSDDGDDGDDGPDAAQVDAAPECDAEAPAVPAHGICDRPVSTPENDVEFGFCVEYTDTADYPYDIEEQCGSQGGTYYPTERACTRGGTVGSCAKGVGEGAETVIYYYATQWDAESGPAHCEQEDGDYEATTGTACPASCGNGIPETPSEECDDGNTDGSDGCDGDCQVELR